MLVGGDTRGGGGGELFGTVHFRVLNTALQMNYQHNSTSGYLGTGEIAVLVTVLVAGTKATEAYPWLPGWECSLSCGRWGRWDDNTDSLVAVWGPWWSHYVLGHEADRWVFSVLFPSELLKQYCKILFYIYLLHLFLYCVFGWVCTHAFMHHCMYVEVRGCKHARGDSLLPLCRS